MRGRISHVRSLEGEVKEIRSNQSPNISLILKEILRVRVW